MKEYAERPSRNPKPIQTPDSYLVIGTKIYGSKLIYFMYHRYLILQDLSVSTLQFPVFNTVERRQYPYPGLNFLAQSLTTRTWNTYCSLLKTMWHYFSLGSHMHYNKTFSVRTLVKTHLKLIGLHTDNKIRQRSWFTLS